MNGLLFLLLQDQTAQVGLDLDSAQTQGLSAVWQGERDGESVLTSEYSEPLSDAYRKWLYVVPTWESGPEHDYQVSLTLD